MLTHRKDDSITQGVLIKDPFDIFDEIADEIHKAIQKAKMIERKAHDRDHLPDKGRRNP
jgi:hypothetical protein